MQSFLEAFPEEMSAIKAVVHDGNKEVYANSILRPDTLKIVNYKNLRIPKREQSKYISNYILRMANEVGSDYIFCFGSKLLKGKLLDRYENKIINFHPSLLPAFPGLSAIDQALNANALLLGNTAHFIDEGIDAGPVIMQSLFSSRKFKEYNDVLNMQIFMLKQIINWLREGRVQITGRNVCIEDADYSIGKYVPSLEFEV